MFGGIERRPGTGRVSREAFANMTQVINRWQIIQNIVKKWQLASYFFITNSVSNPKVDEEKKVEAVRDFYEHAAENKIALASAEGLLFFARVGVPLCILAFSAFYWGYGLTMYMTTS